MKISVNASDVSGNLKRPSRQCRGSLCRWQKFSSQPSNSNCSLSTSAVQENQACTEQDPAQRGTYPRQRPPVGPLQRPIANRTLVNLALQKPPPLGSTLRHGLEET